MRFPYDFDAWGNLIDTIGATPNTYLYTGEQYDSDLGFYYLRARYMDPHRGRFWTMDVWEGSIVIPKSLPKYQYANGNPISLLDPSGLMSISELSIATATIGLLVSVGAQAIVSAGGRGQPGKGLSSRECLSGEWNGNFKFNAIGVIALSGNFSGNLRCFGNNNLRATVFGITIGLAAKLKFTAVSGITSVSITNQRFRAGMIGQKGGFRISAEIKAQVLGFDLVSIDLSGRGQESGFGIDGEIKVMNAEIFRGNSNDTARKVLEESGSGAGSSLRNFNIDLGFSVLGFEIRNVF